MANYIALSSTKDNDTQVMVFNSEFSSLEAMKDLVALGYKCVRFATDIDAYFAYANGKNLKVEIVSGADVGRNWKRIAVEA